MRLRSLKTFHGILVASALIGWAGLAWAADSDGDGIDDAADNCTAAANASQIDTDQDGFGNACDADLDNDGVVGGSDLEIVLASFGTAEGGPNFVPAADHDADGVIAGSDYGFQMSRSGLPVGPSGLACADATGATAPCRP